MLLVLILLISFPLGTGSYSLATSNFLNILHTYVFDTSSYLLETSRLVLILL